MTITKKIEDGEFGYLLNPRPFQNIKPYRADVFLEEIKYIIDKSPKTYIIPDTDVDGVLTAKMMYDMVVTVSDVVPDVHIFEERVHGITSAIAYELVKNKYEYVIIVDSSSPNISELSILTSHGIKVMVVDHHKTKNTLDSYPRGVTIFNNQIDINLGIKIPYSSASCGLLLALYCNYAMSCLGYKLSNTFWLYSAVTLYSDVMDTLNPFNVMVINYVRNYTVLDGALSKISRKKSTTPTRNTITYSITPKINACIRCGRMDLIFRLFFTEISSDEEDLICNEINEINSKIKEILRDIESRLVFKDVLSVSLLDLSEYVDTSIISFKGFLANKVSEQTGNVCIAYYVSEGIVYGSVRDSLGRDVNAIFGEFCKADGHASAFGIEVSELYLEELARVVSIDLQDKKPRSLKPTILDVGEHEFSKDDIRNISLFNEYATTNLICIKMKIDPYVHKVAPYNNIYIIKSAKSVVKSSIPVNYGDTIIVVPTYGSKIELHLKSRCL